jgi:hypothetical protein
MGKGSEASITTLIPPREVVAVHLGEALAQVKLLRSLLRLSERAEDEKRRYNLGSNRGEQHVA